MFARLSTMQILFFLKIFFKCKNIFMRDIKFQIVSNHKPSGDQPKAIKALIGGINKGCKNQTLPGAAASDKALQTSANHINFIQKNLVSYFFGHLQNNLICLDTHPGLYMCNYSFLLL